MQAFMKSEIKRLGLKIRETRERLKDANRTLNECKYPTRHDSKTYYQDQEEFFQKRSDLNGIRTELWRLTNHVRTLSVIYAKTRGKDPETFEPLAQFFIKHYEVGVTKLLHKAYIEHTFPEVFKEMQQSIEEKVRLEHSEMLKKTCEKTEQLFHTFKRLQEEQSYKIKQMAKG